MKRTIITLLAVVAILLAGAASVRAGDKVVLCHAAGLDGTTHYVTLEVGWPAAYGPAGHFYENGTPRAGHEQDYLGACLTPTPSPTTEPSSTPSPTFTPSPSPTSSPPPEPTATPPGPQDSPTPSPTSSTRTPSPTLPPTDTVATVVPDDLGYTIAAFILIVVLAFAAFEVAMNRIARKR